MMPKSNMNQDFGSTLMGIDRHSYFYNATKNAREEAKNEWDKSLENEKENNMSEVKLSRDYEATPADVKKVELSDAERTYVDNDIVVTTSLYKTKNVPKKMSVPEIKRVIFSSDKTIVLWTDNTKTIVSCSDGDVYDPYSGFCAAIVKKLFGNTSKAKKEFNKYYYDSKCNHNIPEECLSNEPMDFIEYWAMLAKFFGGKNCDSDE